MNQEHLAAPTNPAARRRARLLLAAWALALFGLGLLLWRCTPLAEWADAKHIAATAAGLQHAWWGPVAVIVLYVIGGLLVFPITLAIAATAVVFDPAMALVLSFAGVLANATVTYLIGNRLIRGTAHAAFGRIILQVNAALADRSVIAVAIIRNVPLAPFTFVNIAMGTVGVRFRDYSLGTALGIAPGIVAVTVFGHQLRAILERPTPANVALLSAAIAGWIALSLLLQRLISRYYTRK